MKRSENHNRTMVFLENEWTNKTESEPARTPERAHRGYASPRTEAQERVPRVPSASAETEEPAEHGHHLHLPDGCVALVVMNCKGGSQAQNASNNGGVSPSEIFKDCMPAFRAELAIRKRTAVVFLVSEPNWAWTRQGRVPGTLSHLVPNPEKVDGVSSEGALPGGAAVVWDNLARAPKLLDRSPPPSMTETKHNALKSHFAFAELQLPIAGGATGPCHFLCYHGPHKGEKTASKAKKAGKMFKLAWDYATRAGVPMAVGGDFNLDFKNHDQARLVAAVPSGAVFDQVDYKLSERRRRAQKDKIDWLFLLAPPGCAHRLRPCTAVSVLDPAAPHRRVSQSVVHSEFFDHDAIFVCLELVNRRAEEAAVRIQALMAERPRRFHLYASRRAEQDHDSLTLELWLDGTTALVARLEHSDEDVRQVEVEMP